jgi:hypothetical protein
MEATTGSIENAGALTLTAGSGIIFLDSMTGSAVNRSVVFDADYESHGDGTLTVTVDKAVVTNNGAVTVTAWDIDLDGSFSSGTAPTTLHGAKTDQTLGVGTQKDMQVSDAELGRMTSAGGLTVGSSTTANVHVGGITTANSDEIGVISLSQ